MSAAWDDVKTMENLCKVSILPWCDEEFMGRQLRGKNIVYLRKPSPNYLGVGSVMDEDALREHIRKTLNAAEGCTLEFCQRDVYTVSRSADKVRRYVQIVRKEIENN